MPTSTVLVRNWRNGQALRCAITKCEWDEDNDESYIVEYTIPEEWEGIAAGYVYADDLESLLTQGHLDGDI